jgi:hypothetical protein
VDLTPCNLLSQISIRHPNLSQRAFGNDLLNLSYRCGCDVPAHAYTYSWEGNPRWSRAYVDAHELFEYFKGRAKAYGVDEFVHLENRVNSAAWDNKRGKWTIQVTDLRTDSSFEDEGEILINAAGFLKLVLILRHVQIKI